MKGTHGVFRVEEGSSSIYSRSGENQGWNSRRYEEDSQSPDVGEVGTIVPPEVTSGTKAQAQAKVCTKGMDKKGDVNAVKTTNVCSEGGKKNRKGKKHQKDNEEMLLDPTPSEALTSHPPLTTEESDDELGEAAIDITAGEEWVARVEMANQPTIGAAPQGGAVVRGRGRGRRRRTTRGREQSPDQG
ncbi:hypothetical protein H5410_041168 [Solanum commersonii]|uniref:Uncharacterized protein n=1 Tax=Solanum commersonii TaxID=4109 RepID=A0A9J5XUP2_SOLCO|nr:hypothetical protein H5410_041168 [Solanum commersonii]